MCIHKIYGVDRALVSSNYIYFKVMHELLRHIPEPCKPTFLAVYFEEMMLSHIGQAEDLSCHHLPFS